MKCSYQAVIISVSDVTAYFDRFFKNIAVHMQNKPKRNIGYFLSDLLPKLYAVADCESISLALYKIDF